VGDKFPNAQVLGIDLSPIQPDWLPDNVRFLVDNCEEEWLNGSGWDFVHFRHMAPHLKDVDKVVSQVFENLKPGGWIEFQELHTTPQCDDGTMKPDDTLVRFYEHVWESWDLMGYNNHKPRALRGPLRRAGFANIELIKKKLPIGVWAKDKTMRLVGLYLRGCVHDVIPALTAKPFEALGMNEVERSVWAAKARLALDDTSIHRYFNAYFWFAQKPVS